jgi:hypothetical protein
MMQGPILGDSPVARFGKQFVGDRISDVQLRTASTIIGSLLAFAATTSQVCVTSPNKILDGGAGELTTEMRSCGKGRVRYDKISSV